ncbi:MAG: sigma 54-interacting transcriptional regulator [Acidobacteriota bacterium]|nr:sigma 54-interacting transcriptional regulator [Acidobacteriota bacterium]MDH3523486.1 sigma 54-interacting transcriptional regulator [Acidobacteriota bacterium]
MKSSSEILGSFLRGLRCLTGASCAAVYVRGPADGSVGSILLRDGPGDVVPELATPETAAAETAALAGAGTEFGRPSRRDRGWLVPLAHPPETPAADAPDAPRRRQADRAPDREARGWLGLSYDLHPDSRTPRKVPPRSAAKIPPLWRWVADFGADLAERAVRVHNVLRDPVTGLADRIAFQALLGDHVGRARQLDLWLSLVLINPHDFGQVNERHGSAAGDRVMRELAQLIGATLRDSDPLSRYGGAIFAALLPATTPEDAGRVAAKLVQTVRKSRFLDGGVKLELCCGIASLDPAQKPGPEPLDLIRRADHALTAARRAGEGAVETWQESSAPGGPGEAGISEIFTGDLARDYRNMALLRDTVEMVAETNDIQSLAAAVVERLYSACKARRVGLFRQDDEGRPELVRGIARPPSPVGTRRVSFELEAAAAELVTAALAASEIRSGVVESPSEGKQLAFAVPMIAGGRAVGALYVDGAVESIDIDAADLVFFKALASQLSIALERVQLARAESDRGSVELEAELKELRTAVRESKLVYSSAAIRELMATVRRVGPTEATILITGESGTGKELVARSLLDLSPRRDRGLTVVDCGAIAPTLVDSELFGHDHGGYTGARWRRSGRLAEADGGTILLDEIGELPLEVQGRLLRFVEDKQIILAGEPEPRPIDVRVLATTNRNLEEEARAGRFRSDLYHRLNVVRLVVPPLRERPDDIEHLAQHYLTRFGGQYGKVGARFAPDARAAILAYSWPGNVRELQNRILQAVIQLEDGAIDAAALGLPESVAEPALRRRAAPQRQLGGTNTDAALAELREALRLRIATLVADEDSPQLPFGKWIAEDLLLEADRADAGIARRAARRLGLSETTYRRRLGQAVELERAGLAPRPEGWSPVREALTKLLHAQDRSGQPLLRLAESTLLIEILERLPDDEVMGAALLGVTLPTYRRRVRNLEASASATVPHETSARPEAS